MKPYYEHAGITIYHGDCREVLPEFTVGQVAHVLTDPPYNSGMNYGPGTNDQQDWGTYCDWLIGIIIDLEIVRDAQLPIERADVIGEDACVATAPAADDRHADLV